MTHLPFITAAYGLTGLLAIYFAVGSMLRLRQARARLAAIETTSGRDRR